MLCFLSLKISSFEVTPNYEILFFACEVLEVVNILQDHLIRGPSSALMTQLGNFNIAGQLNRSEIQFGNTLLIQFDLYFSHFLALCLF